MENKPKIGKYPFMAEPFHCDFQRQLFMGHLGNHLLNAADFHSNDRGFGMNYLNTINKTWVLSRLAVEMEEMPKAYDRFFVYTWVENAMRYFTNRNFKVEEQSTGKVYGYGRSVWAMIDTETRQPVNLMEIHDGDIVNYVTRELDCPIDKSSRVRMTDDAELVATAMAAYDDIDMNGHVNSIKYIEHVLDLFKLDWYKTHSLRRFEIAYVAEAHEGEMLRFYRCENEPNDFSVRITAQDSGSEETEVVRRRLLFTQFK
jgi:acyl-ACP thioesterase